MREELEVLKNHAYVRSEFRKVRVRISDIDVVHVDGAFLKSSKPLTVLISVDLPEPEGPQMTTTSPFLTEVEQF